MLADFIFHENKKLKKYIRTRIFDITLYKFEIFMLINIFSVKKTKLCIPSPFPFIADNHCNIAFSMATPPLPYPPFPLIHRKHISNLYLFIILQV